MFCLTCRYRLDNLPEPRCPECGRRFNPTDPRTFGPRPRRAYPHWRSAGAYLFTALIFSLLPPLLLGSGAFPACIPFCCGGPVFLIGAFPYPVRIALEPLCVIAFFTLLAAAAFSPFGRLSLGVHGFRSEERRVGEEWRVWGVAAH